MVKKLNTEEFIKKAILVHGDTYDYSKSIYTGRHSKLIIVCRKHGEFIQEAGQHLRNYGCKLCTVRNREYKIKLDTDEFIKKTKEIHKEEYDYSKTQYVGVNKNIIIICREHGEFIQNAGKHMQGSKCKKCCIKKMKSSTEEFIQKSKVVHGDNYCYGKVNYTKNSIQVILICKEHGEFLQTPQSHLAGRGCRKCGMDSLNNAKYLNTEIFIKRSKEIHGDKYDYSKVVYIGCFNKVIIICKDHGEFLQTPTNHLSGSGCKICADIYRNINNRSNNNEFIEKSNVVHNYKYDYSKINYINCKSKLVIICKKHGEFEQEPNSHLSGCGCSKCYYEVISENNKSNTAEFIEKAKLKHNDRYNYTKVEYIKNSIPIIIICKEHGEFNQTPQGHLSGRGCGVCRYITVSNKKMSNTEEFIEKCKEKFGEKYDYSNVQYVNSSTYVSINCNKHDEFLQTPANHLYGHGCTKCAIENNALNLTSNNEEFIEKANIVHKNIYNYSKVKYIKNRVKVIIICNKHGDFKQTPNSHLGGRGCPKCYSNHSKVQIQWLELLSNLYNINIQHAMNEGEFTIPTTRYKADGYCGETNTIYEFHGDYFHGNPKIFKPEEMNKLCKATHGELYQKTLEKEQKIKELGFNLVVMWESDWAKINKAIRCLQNKYKQC